MSQYITTESHDFQSAADAPNDNALLQSYVQLIPGLEPSNGRAIAQTVIRRLHTAAVRVRAHVRSCGICGGQSGTGAGFVRILRFPLTISCHQLLDSLHHLSSGTTGEILADVPSGLCLTPYHEIKKRLFLSEEMRVR
jgi:hypothetical protein